MLHNNHCRENDWGEGGIYSLEASGNHYFTDLQFLVFNIAVYFFLTFIICLRSGLKNNLPLVLP
jgi:hypothetical protein